MATEQKAEVASEGGSRSLVATTTWGGKVEEQYRRVKEYAETYPHVWGSYILVYGGFGLWLTYRWRKLRRTEDSVRLLQERLRKLVEPEQSISSAAVSQKTSTSSSSTNKLPPTDDDKAAK